MQIDLKFLEYNCKDTLSTYLTYEALQKELEEAKLLPFYNKIVQPLANTLVRVNNGGILFDYKAQDAVAKVLLEEIEDEYLQLDRMVGRRVTTSTSQELISFLYEELGLPVLLTTKTGQPSTSKDVLLDLIEEHPDIEPVLQSMLNLRAKQKALNDFVLNVKTIGGRVYPQYGISPVTGRLNCIAHYEKVSTLIGDIPISELKAGDWIYCYKKDEPTTLNLTKVKWVAKTGLKMVIRLHWKSFGFVKKGHLDLTHEHKVRLRTGEYREARDLQRGDLVLALCPYTNIYAHEITKVEELGIVVDVWDLETENEDHNFIVEEVCVSNCKSPNLTQVVNTAKYLYIADPGYVFLYADLDQAEICVIAVLADDKVWLDIIGQGVSVHNQNALDLYGFDSSHKVSSEEKLVAKKYQFGKNYGQTFEGAFTKLSKVVKDLTIDKFRKMVDNFEAKHPGVVLFQEGIANELKETGQIIGIYGRPRKFFAPYTSALRGALNYKMQNGVGDFVNQKMVILDKIIPAPTFNSFQAEFCSAIRIQIHDALIPMVKEKDAQKYADIFKEVLTASIPELGGFKFSTTVEIGKRWSDFVH